MLSTILHLMSSGRGGGASGSIVLMLAGILGGCLSTPETMAPSPAVASRHPLTGLTTDLPLRSDVATILAPGEECVYGVAWQGFLPVGRVIYTTKSVEPPSGPLLVYEGITEPSMLVAAFLRAGGTAKVYVDPTTYLPLSALWVTAEPENPDFRTTWFDREAMVTWSTKWARDFIQTQRVMSEHALDPLSAIYLARALDFGERYPEARLLIVEGKNLHIMTIRWDAREDVILEKRPVACDRLTVRTDRVDESGTFPESEPGNSLYVWIADIPGRPIARMSGRTPFGKVSLSLARRTADGDQ